MKVKYVGDYYKVVLQKDKMYDVLGIEDGWYRINTELEDTAIFPPELFEIIKR